jgi:nucleoside transporter
MNLKIRLVIMNFLEFAVWGAYLTSMGRYLSGVGMGDNIGWFYSVQGLVSLFMPALVGIVADRWLQAQKVYSLCHLLAGAFMIAASVYGFTAGAQVAFGPMFALYTASVMFFMPTIALANSVAYTGLAAAGLDRVKAFPPIRVFGTIGFICTMVCVDLCGFQVGPQQFAVSGVLGLVLAAYALTLPKCPVSDGGDKKSLVDALGLRAFRLFKNRKMAIFFFFSMFLGVSLQITNGFANPYIASFASVDEYAHTFGVEHANILISLSQVSETLCILLIPFFLKRFGIKKVMLISMFAWVLRFALFGAGNPGDGVWMFILSMIVYGVAFDFFNISGSLFVDQETEPDIRSSAQGLFMMMTNGFGASIGMLGAQAVVSHFTHGQEIGGVFYTLGNWTEVWYIFAAYALVVGIMFAICFRYKYVPKK